MANMLEIIKRAAVDAVDCTKPVQVIFGTVMQADPLKIKLEQKIIIESAHMIPTSSFKSATFTPGDRLSLLQMQGGQKFIYLDKVV